MKSIIFLNKIKKEDKLELIDPSKEIADSYIKKAESHFESAKILFISEKFEESISMAYYGMYHSLLALLFKCGIKSENHTASIILLKELFNENKLAKEIEFGKKERIDRQYYIDFKLTKSDCKEMINKTENFILEIKIIIKNLNNEKISIIRNKLEDVLK